MWCIIIQIQKQGAELLKVAGEYFKPSKVQMKYLIKYYYFDNPRGYLSANLSSLKVANSASVN